MNTRSVQTLGHPELKNRVEKASFRDSTVFEYAQIIFVAFVIVFGFIRPFIIEPYKIPSGSMEDTLLVGDRVLVLKFLYGVKLPGIQHRLFAFRTPQRGDVFVFSPKHDPRTHFIKRVVATGGDSVETRGSTLIVSGKPLLNETYVKHSPMSLPDFPPFQGPYPLVPYFFEAPLIADEIKDFTERIPVEVQEQDGVPVAAKFEGATPGQVEVFPGGRRKEINRNEPVPEYFWVTIDTGTNVARGILYKQKQTGQWYFVDRLDPTDFHYRFPDGKPFVVPEGSFWAMGDNRDNSADSRSWGPVPFDAVKGKAILVYWSTRTRDEEYANELSEDDFNAAQKANPLWRWFRWTVRWNRIGKPIVSQYGE